MTDTTRTSLGIKGWDIFEFVVHDLERNQTFYTEQLGLPMTATSSPQRDAECGETVRLFSTHNIRIACVASTAKGSRADKWLHRHPDGIAVVGLRVKDLNHTHQVLTERGACFCNAIQQSEDYQGQPYSWFDIATPLGDVRFRFVQRDHNGLPPGMLPMDPIGINRGYQFIDHVTSNMLTLEPHITWLRDVMGMEEYWRVKFHTSDVKGSGGSGLASIVMWDPGSGIRFANNEPAIPNFEASQIYTFVADNHGSGVQHIALHIPQIETTVDSLRHEGLKFLDVPASYYEMLPARLAERQVQNFKENIADLQKLGILVDGADNKYLLQIFMNSSGSLFKEKQAGPFFYELIQRAGAAGFGEGNFRALFEAIEREETARLQAK